MALIGSLMKTDIVTARPDETVAEVARRMRENGIGAVLVMDGARLAGLFSERDLLTRVAADGKDPKTIPVGDVATHDVVTVEPNTPVRECARLVKEKRFRHLPVMRGDEPVGILSTRDFHEYIVEGLERFIDQTRYQNQLEEGIDPYDHLGGGYEE